MGAGFADAQAALAGLAGGSVLQRASGAAYAEGTTGLARAGPPALVRVRFLEPSVIPGVFTNLPVRWEAAGPGGRPFPVLDADVVLVPHPGGGTVLGVTGTCRSLHKAPGAEPGRLLPQGAAEAMIRVLMRQVGVAIAVAACSSGACHARDRRRP